MKVASAELSPSVGDTGYPQAELTAPTKSMPSALHTSPCLWSLMPAPDCHPGDNGGFGGGTRGGIVGLRQYKSPLKAN